MTRTVRFVALLLILSVTRGAFAWVMTIDKGTWPSTWPKELEPLRARAKTVDVATGTQEHVYTIPFEDRDEFEKLWPILVKLRTPGSPLTLTQVSDVDLGLGKFLSNAKPCVRIKGPAGGYSGGQLRADGTIDLKQLDEGTMLFAGAPWPKELIGPKGELPEYVTSIKIDGGKLAWKPVADLSEKQPGFRNRARIDLELIIDGDVIDLNRIPLPEDAHLVDRRFTEPAAK